MTIISRQFKVISFTIYIYIYIASWNIYLDVISLTSWSIYWDFFSLTSWSFHWIVISIASWSIHWDVFSHLSCSKQFNIISRISWSFIVNLALLICIWGSYPIMIWLCLFVDGFRDFIPLFIIFRGYNTCIYDNCGF